MCVCVCPHRFHAAGMGIASVARASATRDTPDNTVNSASARRYVRSLRVLPWDASIPTTQQWTLAVRALMIVLR